MEEMNAGWYYSPDHGELCQVIEAQTLWGETTCRIWLPGREKANYAFAARRRTGERKISFAL
jgi:hypothetical protein